MRKLTALVAGMTLAMTALPAAAGVIITQKQHVSSGTNSRDTEQTISVQGDKQKMVTQKRTMIIDLGKGMMFVLDPSTKTYFQMDFPPKGAMATMMAASRDAAMNFKKAGTTRDIAGYKCTDYDGGGHVMQGDYTVKECFSKSAPGADEFAAFEKQMTDKLNSASTSSATGEVPGGVPLAMDASMKPGIGMVGNIPGMKPEQLEQIKQAMAKRPPIMTSQVVEKIESRKLAESEFAIPSDYTKKEMPTAPSPGAMRMAPAPAAASPAAH